MFAGRATAAARALSGSATAAAAAAGRPLAACCQVARGAPKPVRPQPHQAATATTTQLMLLPGAATPPATAEERGRRILRRAAIRCCPPTPPGAASGASARRKRARRARPRQVPMQGLQKADVRRLGAGRHPASLVLPSGCVANWRACSGLVPCAAPSRC